MTKHYHDIQKRIDMDLLSRSSFALVVYCILYPSILYPFDLFAKFPLISWGFTGASVFLSLVRLLHIKLSDVFYDRFPVMWMAFFKVFSILHGCLLSGMFVLATYHPEFKPAQTVVVFFVAGISSGGISSLSPNLFSALIFPSVLMVPAIATSFFMGLMPTGWAILMYLVFISVLAIRNNKEYMRTFSIEEQLERQKKELETLSRTDALTGLYIRGYFNTLYSMLWESGVRNNIGLTLMLMDIDHFKHVNDSYGHTSGDECLKIIASSVNECLKRKTDISCRFGGEEFAILISGTPLHETEKLAEKIRKNIESKWIENGEHRFQVTASIGVANILPKIGNEPILLIEQADQALYRAKKSGRNCIRCFSMD